MIAADGRNSVLRGAAGLEVHDLGAALDVTMFRISRRPTDPDEGLTVRTGQGRIFGVINRNTYWQMSYEAGKGGFERIRRTGVQKLRDDMAELVPFLADRVDEITGIDQLRFLEVRVDRLRQWSRPGLLFIGDAAHAMSPAGGSGVNLAIQDAVATANLLARPCSTTRPPAVRWTAVCWRRCRSDGGGRRRGRRRSSFCCTASPSTVPCAGAERSPARIPPPSSGGCRSFSGW